MKMPVFIKHITTWDIVDRPASKVQSSSMTTLQYFINFHISINWNDQSSLENNFINNEKQSNQLNLCAQS